MIRVTVELISARHPSRNRVLGVAEICNDGQMTLETEGGLGSYNCKFSKMEPKLNETWLRSRVEGFDRTKRGGWDLLYLALRAAVGRRNP